ncbi:alpha/beta hydrolase fold domain-containing protein [Flavobacterium sp. 3HN19-14]|uniref:alpha/beta hydrolase fold domain-containing protein n=1 Tax=Flavobacterium sp. 3HN19-14 TaxID=3448133 RepID=UPI003EE2B3B9
MYLPANRTPATKTIILIHGGGWVGGDKADMSNLIPMIKQYLPGYAVANINYRLADAAHPAFPMQIDDIKAMIEKLKAGHYTISNNFGLIGVSAGAHLALVYGYGFDPSDEVKMVCSIVGQTNFTDPAYLNNVDLSGIIFAATGMTYAENPGFYEQWSPLFRAVPNVPATILFYGNADPLVPTSQGIDLHNKLNGLGIYNEFTLYNGGHGDWGETDQIDMYTKLIAFVQAKL